MDIEMTARLLQGCHNYRIQEAQQRAFKAKQAWIDSGGKCCVCGEVCDPRGSMYYEALGIGVCFSCKRLPEFIDLLEDSAKKDSREK